MIDNFLVVWNFNRLFLKLNRFIYNELPVLPDQSRGYGLLDFSCAH